MNIKEYEILIKHLPRLRWACRRGMLELDVILNNFLDSTYEKLTEAEKIQFVKLLDEADPELFNWLLGSVNPKQEFSHIVSMIRKVKHNG